MEEIGRADDAEPVFRKLATTLPAPAGALSLARFVGANGDPEEALGLLEKSGHAGNAPLIAAAAGAIARNPAITERLRGRLKAWLDSARAMNPGDSLLTLAAADVAEQAMEWKTAMALYDGFAPNDPHRVAALNNLAVLRALNGEAKVGLLLIEEAITRAGTAPPLLDTRAVARLKAGQSPDDAIKDLESAIAIQPTAVRYFHLALAFQAAGNAYAAEDALTRARDLGLRPAQLHPLERDEWKRLSQQHPPKS
jgi:tetratricopeptide (TPR) repeat protein